MANKTQSKTKAKPARGPRAKRAAVAATSTPAALVPKPPRAPAVQIRPHSYRGVAGFLVVSPRARIFVRARPTAEAIRVAVRVNDQAEISRLLLSEAKR